MQMGRNHRGLSGHPFAARMDHARQWLAKNAHQTEHRVQMRGPELELTIFDFIGYDWWSGTGVSADWVKAQLDKNRDVRTIRVLLNSPGGDYFDGTTIHNLLKRHSAKVIVEVLGEASSAASVIQMAGDEILMHQGAMTMIHEAWSIAAGNARDFESAAQMLRKVNASAVDVYEQRTGQKRTDVESWVEATTWFSAAEAVEKGFADKVIKAPQSTAKDTRVPEPGQQRGEAQNSFLGVAALSARSVWR